MLWLCFLALSAAIGQEAVPPTPQPPAAATAPTAPAAKTPTSPEKAPPPKPVSPADAMRKSMELQRAAMEKQREAVRKQAEMLGVSKPGDPISPSAAGAAQADCDPLPDDVLSPLIESNAKAQEVKPELLRAVMQQES